MSCLKYLKPVEALGKLLGDQDTCIEPVYRSICSQVGESVSVSVELQLAGLITKGEGTCLDDAKQKAALAMMEKIEEIHFPSHRLKTTSVPNHRPQTTSVLMKSDQNCVLPSNLTLKTTKKFWVEWRLQKEVANLLKQLSQVKGQDFSCLDDQLNKVRHFYLVQDMEYQSTLLGDNIKKIEKLPLVEIKANEKSFPLTKETLEIHDKKVGKMTVIDRLGISSLDNTGENIDKNNYDEDAVTETTSIGSINTFDAKSSSTFDQSEEADALNQANQFSSTFNGNQSTESNQNNFRKMTNFKNDYTEIDKVITEPMTEEGRGKKKTTASEPPTESPLKWLMLLVQSGCDYEAEETEVLRCLSKFGEVEVLEWAKGVGYYKGGGGRVKFANSSTAMEVVNRVFTVDGCSFHTSWRRQDLHLLEGPVPFQVLLESDHLPHTWEKHMIVKGAMVQYGEVLAVDFIHARKVVVSFSDEWVVQNLLGCWWKVNGTPVLAKEVTSLTLDN